jgi:2,3,4,5-tetrahydropyridine-2-carboxylate N-succinyltransferase
MSTDLAAQIEAAWERRTELSPQSKGADVEAIEAALDMLDSGQARVATRGADGRWETQQWLKKAVLLSFRITANQLIGASQANGVDPSPGPWWDKVHSKFLGWGEASFQKAGFRAVPGAVVRRGAHVAKNVVLMPSFVNIGAYVDEGAMIDTWATVGSCAQIGKNVHLSGGAGIGGVLEPIQANPTIIEDDCFIGARSEVAEGVIVRQGAVLAMGTFISQSTKIVDRATGEVMRGEVPAYSVVVPGSLPDAKGGPSLACAVIVKRVDAQTRAKTSINDLLRD